jgi:hypothetical protein
MRRTGVSLRLDAARTEPFSMTPEPLDLLTERHSAHPRGGDSLSAGVQLPVDPTMC